MQHERRDLTRTQKLILLAVIEHDGQQVIGLYQLALRLGIDYRWARRCVKVLEAAGLLYVIRPSGREMLMTPHMGTRQVGDRRWGVPVFSKSPCTKHKAQGKGEKPMDTPESGYTRPELSQDEQAHYAMIALGINAQPDNRKRLTYILDLVRENVRLLREVNEHREARGIDPLPLYGVYGKQQDS